MSKPLIQIDDLVREMTDDEHTQWLQDQANAPQLLEADNDNQ